MSMTVEMQPLLGIKQAANVLGVSERTLFQRLSVFSAGFDLEAAEVVFAIWIVVGTEAVKVPNQLQQVTDARQ